MGKIEGIKIQNYGVLKDIVLGKTRTNQKVRALGNLVAVIGPSGNGKSTLADAFGFIADCLEMGVEMACDANNRGGFEKLISQGAAEPILFELYYRESSNTRPITYELEIDLDKTGRPYVKRERLRQRVESYGLGMRLKEMTMRRDRMMTEVLSVKRWRYSFRTFGVRELLLWAR